MNYSQLKNAIAEVIRTNGNEEITGEVLQYTLLEMVSVLGKDYQFAGVGTPLTDTTERDDNVAWILGRGTYENFGNPFTVAVDEIAVVKYDGTFTVEKIKTGVVVDSELTLEGTNPVEGGAIAREFAKMRAAGYFFAGIMTPTGTPPHEITEKIFYLCTQAGVYPNFDSIVLDRGLNILKWNGSRWSADLVFAITDDVTEGLASLLTSAGAYAAIAAEAQLRQEGDAAVQQNIDAVEALIPSQASVDNKLVDEQKMNSSIATATATYRGAYNQVSNLNLGVDATHEQVALALASQMTYLHITPDNNDYCYVLVPTSAETPTEIAHIDRYKFNGTAWGYEYTLNNSGYTAAQWAAINSGITSGLVAKLGALPTAQELAAALLAKQDVLTFDNAPTQSSTNPVTSGGVYTAIDNEKTARQNVDGQIQQAIEAILALIPSAATALNQLADKAFVNSSIATATATFRGTFNLVSDLQLTVDATHADIAAALLNAISTADNNDYAFVQIPTSVDTPTEIRVTERYKFDGTAWQYEYDLNNSGFTAAQWAAINSGITALLVTKLSNLPNATELAALFAGKQNVLTFDSTPTPSSANPVTSGGLYDKFEAIIAKIPSDASANNKLVAENRLAAYVGGIIGALDATFDLTSTDGHVTLRMTQTDGVITSLQILTSDIASASALATLGGQVSTNADDIAALQALYNALQQSAPEVIEPTDTWPVASPSATVIYRVIDRVNTSPQYYSDYMFKASDLTTPVLMATYNNAIDAVPTAGSHNLVESGGIAAAIESVKTIYGGGTDGDEAISFVDEQGNCAMQVKDGHIKTKEFDSSSTIIQDNIDRNEESLSFVDENDNGLVQFKGGHIKTKFFNSRNLQTKSTKFASLEMDSLQILGTSSKTNDVISIASGVSNRVQIPEDLQSWYYKILCTVKCTSGTAGITIGKDGYYGTLFTVSGGSLVVKLNGNDQEAVSIGFSLELNRVYTVTVSHNVSTSKADTFEIYDDFGNYFSYTTPYTAHSYGNPVVYSETADMQMTKFAMTMQERYNPNLTKMIVTGHSYVEADSLGDDRESCFVSLLDNYNGDNSVVNCGLGGDTVAAMNNKIPYFIKMCPNTEYILMCVGGNDRTATADQIIERLETSLSIVSNSNKKPVLFTINPASAGYENEAFTTVNSWIRQSGFLYVDMDKVFYNPDGTINQSLYLQDGLHPTIEGHLRIFRRIQMDCPFLF